MFKSVAIQRQGGSFHDIAAHTYLGQDIGLVPGGIFAGTFAERDISLSLIHSRSVIGRAWHYPFYIDAGCGTANPGLQQALYWLKARGHEAIVLGSYVSGR